MNERLYRSLYRIRRVEEEVARVYPTDRIKSPVHLSIGQEAVSVGVCEALRPDDVVFGTYRCHALYLAKGGDLKAMIAELYGKGGRLRQRQGRLDAPDRPRGRRDGHVGRGRHDHPERRRLRLRPARCARTGAVVASFFGDGATEEGVFPESLNFAALKRLPVLFVCENNGYAIHTHQSRRQATLGDLRSRPRHGIPAERSRTTTCWNCIDLVRDAVARIRAGGGPLLLRGHDLPLAGARRPGRRLPPRLSLARTRPGPGSRTTRSRAWRR